MTNTNETTATSPRQPLNGQGVLRISIVMSSKSRKASKLKIAIINISTMRGKEEELVDIMKNDNLSIVGLSETSIKGSGEKILHENCKLIYSGQDDGRHGVGWFFYRSLLLMSIKLTMFQRESLAVPSRTGLRLSL